MIVKKIIDLCKKAGNITLYDNETGKIQWISDGEAFYPLYGLPKFDESELYSTFDISEKQQKKIVFRHCGNLPAAFDFSDYCAFERECVRKYLLVTGESEVAPYHTTQGIKFILQKHLSPLSDAQQLSICERKTAAGEIYFAVKIGFILLALIMPHDALNETYVEQLRNFANECDRAFEKKRSGSYTEAGSLFEVNEK